VYRETDPKEQRQQLETTKMRGIRALLLMSAMLYNFNFIDGQTNEIISLNYNCIADGGCNGVMDACGGDGVCVEGTCTADTKYNYDCLTAAVANVDACTGDNMGCDPDNTFYCADTNADTCDCKQGWTTYPATGAGTGCTQQRLEVRCFTDGFQVFLLPYSDIANAHFLNVAAHTECVLTEVSDRWVYVDDTTKMPYGGTGADPCNFAVGADGTGDDAGSKMIKLYLQRQALYRSEVDYLAEIKCVPPEAGDDFTYASVKHMAKEPAQTAVTVTSDIDTGIVMLITSTSDFGTEIAADLTAGAQFAVVINSPRGGTSVVTDTFVSAMSVANHDLDPDVEAPAGGTIIPIIDDYCIKEDGIVTKVVKTETTADSNDVLQIQIHMNVPYIVETPPSGSNQGDTWLSVTVCINTCSATDADACTFPWSTAIPALTTANGRKKRDTGLPDQREKRQAEGDLPDDVTGVLLFHVRDPNTPSIVVQTGSNDNQHDNCHQTMMFILPLALMGCLLLLSLVLLCFFYSKLRVMMGEQKHGSTNMAYKS